MGQQFPTRVFNFVRGLFRGLLPLKCLSSMERCVRGTTGHGTRCFGQFEACVDNCLGPQNRPRLFSARVAARLQAAADRAQAGTTRDPMRRRGALVRRD